VIIFFAKHANIGSFVVAKEVVKLIERSNRTNLNSETDEKRIDNLLRLYGILQMLLSQFSIVLCYQPAFYQQTLEQIADTMVYKQDVPSLRSSCSSIVLSLYQIDAKLLDAGIGKLDLLRKTPMKKLFIETETNQRKG
jgi:hypothetical protein